MWFEHRENRLNHFRFSSFYFGIQRDCPPAVIDKVLLTRDDAFLISIIAVGENRFKRPVLMSGDCVVKPSLFSSIGYVISSVNCFARQPFNCSNQSFFHDLAVFGVFNFLSGQSYPFFSRDVREEPSFASSKCLEKKLYIFIVRAEGRRNREFENHQ